MVEARDITKIDNDIIKNYQEMVEILKEGIELKDKLISIYERQLLGQDKYIEILNRDILQLKSMMLK